MAKSFDPAIVSPRAIELARAMQATVPCVLGGGATLAGVYLQHRLSRDLDFVCREREAVRTLASTLPETAASVGLIARVVRDAGTFVRATVEGLEQPLEIDLLYEPTPPVSPPDQSTEGLTIASLEDMRASKLTCILSRSEPRDLVDLLFLDRAGYPPEKDVDAALTKDGGVDPAILAWLLRQFPTTPLPQMLLPMTSEDLSKFRDELAERFATLAVPRG